MEGKAGLRHPASWTRLTELDRRNTFSAMSSPTQDELALLERVLIGVLAHSVADILCSN
jgi:hypothetical protein